MKNAPTKKNLIARIVNNEEGLYHGDLRYYFRIIFKAPNVNNPYHNFRHMMHIFCQSYEGGKYERIDKTKMRALLIAALFHDYGHSGRIKKDKKEIAAAIKHLKKFLLADDRPLLPDIEELIRSTEWPHRCDVRISKSMKILRDADFSQTLDDVWWQQIIFGLSREQGIPPVDLLKSQIDFISKLKFQSEWGKHVLRPKIPIRIIELNEFLDILL